MWWVTSGWSPRQRMCQSLSSLCLACLTSRGTRTCPGTTCSRTQCPSEKRRRAAPRRTRLRQRLRALWGGFFWDFVQIPSFMNQNLFLRPSVSNLVILGQVIRGFTCDPFSWLYKQFFWKNEILRLGSGQTTGKTPVGVLTLLWVPGLPPHSEIDDHPSSELPPAAPS